MEKLQIAVNVLEILFYAAAIIYIARRWKR